MRGNVPIHVDVCGGSRMRMGVLGGFVSLLLGPLRTASHRVKGTALFRGWVMDDLPRMRAHARERRGGGVSIRMHVSTHICKRLGVLGGVSSLPLDPSHIELYHLKSSALCSC